MISNKKQHLNHQVVISIKDPLEKEGLPLITFDCGGTPLTFLLDTGSSHCLISSDVVDKLPRIEGFDLEGTMYGIYGKLSNAKKTLLSLSYKDYHVFSGYFTVSPLKFPKKDKLGRVYNRPLFHGILGLPFLAYTGTKINYQTKKAYINGLSRNKQSTIQGHSSVSLDELERQCELLEQQEELAVRLGDDGIEPTLG